MLTLSDKPFEIFDELTCYSGQKIQKLFYPSDSINKAIENIFSWNTVTIVFTC